MTLTEIGSAAIAVATAAGEFLEIMTRAEGRTIGGKHNCAHGLVGRKFGKAVGQSNQQGFRKTVAGFRTIEHEDGYVAITLAQQHGRIGSKLGRRSIHLKAFPYTTPANDSPKSGPAQGSETVSGNRLK